MNILNEIASAKQKEIEEKKGLYPIKLLERSVYFDGPTLSMCQYLSRENASGIIAEFKRKSPSKGEINPYADVESVSVGYMQSGASALSVLTDKPFFSGSEEDLTKARQNNFCPILRKDFIVDSYQIYEARCHFNHSCNFITKTGKTVCTTRPRTGIRGLTGNSFA